jgi:hypothetical protein
MAEWKKGLLFGWLLWILAGLAAFVAPKAVDHFLLWLLRILSFLLVPASLTYGITWLYRQGIRGK